MMLASTTTDSKDVLSLHHSSEEQCEAAKAKFASLEFVLKTDPRIPERRAAEAQLMQMEEVR